jgi:prepilin-type N-terminal cleavage/methylation domain-containing protein
MWVEGKVNMKKLKAITWGLLKYKQKGFTLLELLIVMAILGMLAGVIVPNVSGFIKTGNLSAANAEVQNVMTGTRGYMAEHSPNWPVDSDELGTYLSDLPKTNYIFNTENGLISGVGGVEGNTTDAVAWPDLTFHFDDQQWKKD